MDSTLDSHGSGADDQLVDAGGVNTRPTAENIGKEAELPPSSVDQSPSDSPLKKGSPEASEEKAEDKLSKLLRSEAGTKQIVEAMMKMFGDLLTQQTETMKNMTKPSAADFPIGGTNLTSSILLG